MAYSNFNLDSLRKAFDLKQKRERLFPEVAPVAPTPWLTETLHKSMQLVIESEKARSEMIVTPILLASRDLNNHRFAIYSGKNLNVDPDKGLTGECDFIITLTPPLPTIQAPIFALVEAKQHNIDGYLGQCAAQMLGAKRFNQAEGQDFDMIFGCVTSGETWQFLRLSDEGLAIDTMRYYINRVEDILGVLQGIVNHYDTGQA